MNARVMVLTGLVLCALFGPSQFEGILTSMTGIGGEEEAPAVDPSEPQPLGDVGAAAEALGEQANAMLQMSSAVREVGDVSQLSENGRDRMAEYRESYDENRAIWLISLTTIPLMWVLFGFAGAFASLAFVARKLGEAGVLVAQTWLGVMSIAVPVATLLSGQMVWPVIPPELFVVPVLWLVGCAGMQRVIDENAPVWNALIQSLLALVASMAASVVFYLVTPFGASDAIDTADAL